MGKRLPLLDTLHEVRKALRVLRRVERFLMQTRRDQDRRDKKRADDSLARQQHLKEPKT